MSAAAQQMNMLKSLRNTRSSSRTSTAPIHVKRAAAPPLPPCPKEILPETSADTGDPYQHQSNSIFQCGIRGFLKWYDKETWKFFEDENDLYFTHSPRSRKRASSAAAAAAAAATPSTVKTVDDMPVNELIKHMKETRKKSKDTATKGKKAAKELLPPRSKSRGTAAAEKKQRKSMESLQQKKQRTSIEGSIKKLANQAQAADSTTAANTAVANTAANSAVERLVASLASFKSIKLCVDAGGDPTSSNTGYDVPSESELAQGFSFVRKQVKMFESRAWTVARAGGVGSMAAIVHYYVRVRKSLAPWIVDALDALFSICELLFEATKKGTSKKGLKRTLKLDLVVLLAAVVIIAAAVPDSLAIQAAPILESSLSCLRLFCDELCPADSFVDSLKDLFKGQDDFVESGGLHALLLVSCRHGMTNAGKSARILLKRFSLASLAKVKEDRLINIFLQTSEHVNRFSVESALADEIEKRKKEKEREEIVQQSMQKDRRREKHETAIQKLADDAKKEKDREKEREQSKQIRVQINVTLRKRELMKEKEREEKEREAEKKRRALVQKRAELDKEQQEKRLKKMELIRQEAEMLRKSEEERSAKNQESYDRWKNEKAARKQEILQKRQKLREEAHEANIQLLAQLHAKLKSQVVGGGGKGASGASGVKTVRVDTTQKYSKQFDEPKLPTPPAEESRTHFARKQYPTTTTKKKRNGQHVPKGVNDEDIDNQMSEFFGTKSKNKTSKRSSRKSSVNNENAKNELGHSFDFNSMAIVGGSIGKIL